MLHSGRLHPRWSRHSVLAEPAGSLRFHVTEDGQASTRFVAGTPPFDPGQLTNKPFHDLRLAIQAAGDGLWIGYFTYDLGRWIERLPETTRNDRRWPIFELAWCPGYLVHDTAKNRWTSHGSWRHGNYPSLDRLAPEQGGFRASNLSSVFDRARFEAAVQRTIDYIAAGDIFQANLAQRFSAEFEGDYPLAERALYRRLAEVSPAWYGAYLELAAEADASPKRTIASISPELFLELDADRNVVTRPIKGTRPATSHTDELRASAKDAAELHMIVDLLRNDLGRVCSYGSVKVTQPREIESHPTVHHGVATVTGRLHASMDVVDLLRATMPGGSITGAPKIRAMEIIEELEPVRRGPYCGAIGMLSRDSAALSVAIRTMLIERSAGAGNARKGRVDFSVGGGVVADSVPAAEYQETLDKAQAMLHAMGLRVP